VPKAAAGEPRRGEGTPMALAVRWWPSGSMRWAAGAAFTLAGGGGFLAAAVAVSTSTAVRAGGGAAGAVAGLAAATLTGWAHDRDSKREAIRRARDAVLLPLTEPAPPGDRTILGLLDPARDHAPAFQGRRTDLATLGAWRG
jgi:hypothetical protein